MMMRIIAYGFLGLSNGCECFSKKSALCLNGIAFSEMRIYFFTEQVAYEVLRAFISYIKSQSFSAYD